MSETKAGSASATQVDPLMGRWPVVNLIAIEAEDFAKTSGEGNGTGDDPSSEEEEFSAGSWVVRIHMDIELRTPGNYRNFRAALKRGRPHARKFLDDNGLLPAPTPEALAVVDVVLPK